MGPDSVAISTPTESWLKAPLTDKDLARRRLLAPAVPNGRVTPATPRAVPHIQLEHACRLCPHCKKLLSADRDGDANVYRSEREARELTHSRNSSGRRHQSVQEEERPLEPELELVEQPSSQRSSQTEERRQLSTTQLKFRLLCALGLLWLASGLAFFVSMGYHLIDAIYSMAQILTTVGYGDIVPEKPHEKLVTAFIVLSSTLLMAGLVSHTIDVFLDTQEAMLEERLRAKEEQIKAGQTNDHVGLQEEAKRLSKLKTQGLVQSLTFIFFVVVGTLFYALVEPCSCSYGKTLIPDCVPENCYERGEVKTYVDAFYMCIITISTVGYGDLTPQSQMGRLFGTFWMLFGVGSIINLVGTVTDLLKEVVETGERARMTQEMFHKMDTDGDGQLDKYEFMRLQLVMLGLAQEEELDSIETQFELIDESGDGNISLEEFRNFYM